MTKPFVFTLNLIATKVVEALEAKKDAQYCWVMIHLDTLVLLLFF